MDGKECLEYSECSKQQNGSLIPSIFRNLKMCLCLDIHNDLRLTGFPERVVIYNTCGHILMRIQAHSIKPLRTVAYLFFLVKIREDG